VSPVAEQQQEASTSKPKVEAVTDEMRLFSNSSYTYRQAMEAAEHISSVLPSANTSRSVSPMMSVTGLLPAVEGVKTQGRRKKKRRTTRLVVR
jgi:hypothetical protein